MKRIPQAWKGCMVDFHGFDGEHYTANVKAIRNGVAVIEYFPRMDMGEYEPVIAYVGADTWSKRINQPKS